MFVTKSLPLSLFVVTLSFKTFVRQLEKFCRPINYETFDSLNDITANGGNKFYTKILLKSKSFQQLTNNNEYNRIQRNIF